jgi:hypothetical protein
MLDKKDYQDAINVQDACNLSGVVKSLARVMDKIWDEAREGNRGTDWVNRHPIVRLYIEQLVYLNHGGMGDSDSYQSSYAMVKKRIEEINGDAKVPFV